MNSTPQPSHLRLTLWIAIAFGAYNVFVRLLPYGLEAMGFAVNLDAGICPWNYSPMMALCLFGAARFSNGKMIWMVGLGSYFVSDLFLAIFKGPAYAFHPIAIAVYAGFAIGILLGGKLRKIKSVVWILGAGIAAETSFFLLTNFMVWVLYHGQPPTNYGLTPGGLLTCYVMALPWFGRALISTAMYGSLFFGVWSLVGSRTKSPAAVAGEAVTS